jgi:phage tail-like protein
VFFKDDTENPIAGVNKVSALKKTTQVVKHRSGGDMGVTRKSIGQTDYEAITLERGVTYDPSFEIWANRVWSYTDAAAAGGDDFGLAEGASDGSSSNLNDPGPGNDEAGEGFRRDISIVMYNVAGQEVLKYHVYRCWPSEFTAVPELDASGNAVAIQTIVLQNEGWELDADVSTAMLGDQTPTNALSTDDNELPVTD